MADRGLYARWLFQAILDCGWHPFLRINLEVKARAVGEETFDWIERWITDHVYRSLHKDIDPTILLRLRQVSDLLAAVWDNAALLLDEG